MAPPRPGPRAGTSTLVKRSRRKGRDVGGMEYHLLPSLKFKPISE